MVPEGSQWLTNPTETIQPGDLYRVREDSHSEYCEWQSADHYAGTEVGFFAAWHSRDIQFCRPVRPAAKSDDEQKWEPLPIEDDTVLQPGRDEVRLQSHDGGRWCAWMPLSGGPLLATAFLAQRPSNFTYEFRRLKAAPEQPPAPTTDRGERYRRTITQSLPGDTHGLSITVDLADVFDAFGVPYMLGQAVKKTVLPGERGSKGRLKDLREAAWHIQRQIQIEEARQQERADL